MGNLNPVMLRDADFGIVRLRAFGAYSLRVADPSEFIKQIAGTNAQFQTDDIDGQLKRAIVTEFSDAIGEMKIPALDLAAQYKEIGEQIRSKINEDFKGYGLEVTKFYVENVSLPPEVEAAMDKRASMGALGDAQNYMQFQAADALRDAAQNEGGGAGLGAGLGAGFAVGGQMEMPLASRQEDRHKVAAELRRRASHARAAAKVMPPELSFVLSVEPKWKLQRCPVLNAAPSFAKEQSSVQSAARRRKRQNALTVSLNWHRVRSSVLNAVPRPKQQPNNCF